MQYLPEATETTSASFGQKVYHLRYWLLFAVLIAACLLTLPVLTIFLALADPADFHNGLAVWLILLSLFSLGVAAALIFGLWNSRLVIAPEGITYYGIGYRVYSPWWNTKGIGSMWLGARLVNGLLLELPASEGVSLQEGMRQQRPVLEVSGWLHLELKALPVLRVLVPLGGLSQRSIDEALDMRRYGSIIPISLFVRQWQHSEAAWIIAQYAPQVFG
jgi:hypothetical protein